MILLIILVLAVIGYLLGFLAPKEKEIKILADAPAFVSKTKFNGYAKVTHDSKNDYYQYDNYELTVSKSSGKIRKLWYQKKITFTNTANLMKQFGINSSASPYKDTGLTKRYKLDQDGISNVSVYDIKKDKDGNFTSDMIMINYQ